jgi:hypothetical protein
LTELTERLDDVGQKSLSLSVERGVVVVVVAVVVVVVSDGRYSVVVTVNGVGVGVGVGGAGVVEQQFKRHETGGYKEVTVSVIVTALWKVDGSSPEERPTQELERI